MNLFNLQSLKKMLPLLLFGLLVSTVLGIFWIFISNLPLLFYTKVDKPLLNKNNVDQNLVKNNLNVSTSLKNFNPFTKAVLYKKTGALPVPDKIAAKLGFSRKSVQGKLFSYTKGKETLTINLDNLYLEYTNDPVLFKPNLRGEPPLLDTGKTIVEDFVDKVGLNEPFLDLHKAAASYSQGLQGLSEADPKHTSTSPAKASFLNLFYPLSVGGKPLVGAYPEVYKATALFGVNSQLLSLKLPLINENWSEDISYPSLSAPQILDKISSKKADLVYYSLVPPRISVQNQPIIAAHITSITPSYFIAGDYDYLLPIYSIKADGLVGGVQGASVAFYLPAFSDRFFK